MLRTLNKNLTYNELIRKLEILQDENLQYQSVYGSLDLPENYSFTDLVDINSMQQLLNEFYELAGFGIGISDHTGTMLVSAGWQEVCKKYHEAHTENCKFCKLNNQLFFHSESNEIIEAKCKNGLWDAGLPIIVSNKTLAGVFFGQFFYDDDVFDESHIVDQGINYNFDINDYITQLKSVPKLPRKKIKTLISVYSNLVQQIVNSGYQKLVIQQLMQQAKSEHKESIHYHATELKERNEDLSTSNNELINLTEELKSLNEELINRNTQYEELNKELNENKDFLNTIIEQSPDPMWISDKYGTVILVNKALCDMLKVSKAEIVFKYNVLNDNIVKEKGLLPLVKNVFEKGKPIDFIIEYNTADTQTVKLAQHSFTILHTFITPIKNPQGKTINAICQHRDITQLKLAEKEVLESKELFGKVIEFLPVGIALSNPHGSIQSLNRKFTELFGYTKADLKDIDTWFMLAYPEEQYRKELITIWSTAIEQYIKGKPFPIVEARVTCKDGSLKDIKFAFEQLGDLYITSFTNLTSQKRSQAQLKEANTKLKHSNNTKDKFFSIIAHDLVSPFNTIIGYSELITEQVNEHEYKSIDKFSTNINRAAYRVLDLINNLLDWARIQTGKIELSSEDFDLTASMHTTLELFKWNINQKNLKLTFSSPPSIAIHADKRMLETVFRNLVSNAIKFTPIEGSISIEVSASDSQITLSVADSGVGIKKEDLSKLFNEETSFSTHGTEKEPGTGLGLILCKELLELHSGTLQVQSQPKKGSTFICTIPLILKK